MRIAVQGCCHGELDEIYKRIEGIEDIDLLIICGDFQSIRTESDLDSMACPQKYKKIGSFHKYYNGEKKAPILTIFIGGNHEASNYLWELYYGGWVAENIYFLGYSGSVIVNGIRIAGISGIFNQKNYNLGHFETFPYNESTIRSVYHVRKFEVQKLLLLQEFDHDNGVQIFLSHDWPRGIEKSGDWKNLIKKKPFFKNEIENNSLGSPAAEELLNCLVPENWFSAHLHVKFEAEVNFKSGKKTKFLALDKCVPGRNFLEILEIETPPWDKARNKLFYDSKWLAILRATNKYMSLERTPSMITHSLLDLEKDHKWVKQNVKEFKISSVFSESLLLTKNLCDLLDIENKTVDKIVINPDEIFLEL